MDPDRWKTVNEIFNAALELPPEARQSYLATATAEDDGLRAEVDILLHADANAGSYMETPLLAGSLLLREEIPVKEGDVLCGRFKIVRGIAEGGMGRVFEAFDTELAVRVALKLIRSELSSDSEALARFRQEVRLARGITHPNVCRTFDLERETIADPSAGAEHQLIFLTMEFLEGETLDARIRRVGALPLTEAGEIARQLAGALQAAHGLGIVHRDMKPANVMLVPDASSEAVNFRAVITDFGLARVNSLIESQNASALSQTARPIGTLAYMAPEQLQGAKVFAVADVYAFGLILFEMVTGHRAFPSDNFLSGIAQRLTGPAPDPKAYVPSLSESWCRAIAGCLRAKPEERFQSVVDAAAALGGERARLPRLARHRSVDRWLEPRQLAWLALCLVAGVALLAGIFRLYQSRAESKVVPGALIYLTGVKNDTGEKTLDNLTELIRAGLAQSVQVNLLDQGRVGDILQQMTKPPETVIDAPIAREIAMRAGAERVIFAVVSGSEGNYKLNLDIQQPDNTPSRYRNHWTESYTWHSAPSTQSGTIAPELLTIVRTASDWIRRETGESANDIARLNVSPEEATTNNWEALNEFDLAESLDPIQEKDAQVRDLDEAIKLDPNFSLAYAKLGGVLVSMERYTEGYTAYNQALEKDAGYRLSRRERDMILGDFASDTRDFQSAIDAYRDAANYYPKSVEVWTSQVYPLDLLDRPLEALSAASQAESLSSGTHPGAGGMAYTEMQLGNYAEARHWIDVVRKSGRIDYSVLLEGFDDFLSGDLKSAGEDFQRLTQSSDPHFRRDGFACASRLEAEEGQFQQALDTLDSPGRINSRDLAGSDEAARILDEAYLYGHLKHYDRMLDLIDETVKYGSSPDAIILASGILGRFMAAMPQTLRPRGKLILHGMEKFLDPKQISPVFSIARFRVRGELELAAGNASGAIQSFQHAGALDAVLGPRDYLARALLAKAAQTTNQVEADNLRREALSCYARVALRPVVIWRRTMDFPSGSFADAMQDYVDVAQQMHLVSHEVVSVTNALEKLRSPIHSQ